LEQLIESENLLQHRISLSGAATIKKAGSEQQQYSTSQKFWWPVPEELSPPPNSNKNWKWYFEALESEQKVGISDEENITQDSILPIERHKTTSIAHRSWRISSDGKDKILEELEDRQSITSLESIKENNEPEQSVKATEMSSSIEQGPPNCNSVELAVAKLKIDVVESMNALKKTKGSEIHVSFKNPVLSIVARQPVDSERILMKNTKRSTVYEQSYNTPKPQLRDLIEGIRSDSASRRSNASGTLKIMASQKQNVEMLGSADGLLDALLFAAELDCEGYDAEANRVTKNRALTTLALLCQGQENRRLICGHKNLIPVLFNILKSDDKEGRLHACSCFAALAKTEENRDILADKEGLISEIAEILLTLKEDMIPHKKEDRNELESIPTLGRVALSTRLNACAAVLHLSKQCNISVSEFLTCIYAQEKVRS
jgi:hypothetical protein